MKYFFPARFSVLFCFLIVSCEKINVTPEPVPICTLQPKFSLSANNCLAPCTITFINEVTSYGSEDKFKWDFGTVSTSTLMNPGPVTFTQPGTYPIKLTMTNSICSRDTTITLTVLANTFQKNFGTVGEDSGIGVLQSKAGDYWLYGHSLATINVDKLLNLDSIGNLKHQLVSDGPFDNGLTAIGLATYDYDGYVALGSGKSPSNNKIFLHMDGFTRVPGGTGSFSANIYGPVLNNQVVSVVASSISTTTDGGWVIGGYVIDHTGGPITQASLIKTTSSGGAYLNIVYPTISSFGTVRALTSGGYIATYSKGPSGNSDIHLVKLDNFGTIQWDVALGTTSNDWATDILPTADGGFVVLGETYGNVASDRDIYLFKTNSTGGMQWQKTFGGTEEEFSSALKILPTGEMVIVGHTESKGAGKFDIHLIKTNSLGTLIWEKTYGGVEDDRAENVIVTKDGGFAIVGSTSSQTNGGRDIYFIKTDKNGNF